MREERGHLTPRRRHRYPVGGVFWRRKTKGSPGQAAKGLNVFDGLRNQALASTAADAGWKSRPPERRVYGALLDWGLDSATATVFALDDGTASLYLSSGGGIIGGGSHYSVRDAARAFVGSFEPFLDDMEPDADGATPPGGTTDLRALTLAGRLRVRGPTGAFGRRQHPMSEAFDAGQALIAQLRQVAEKQS